MMKLSRILFCSSGTNVLLQLKNTFEIERVFHREEVVTNRMYIDRALNDFRNVTKLMERLQENNMKLLGIIDDGVTNQSKLIVKHSELITSEIIKAINTLDIDSKFEALNKQINSSTADIKYDLKKYGKKDFLDNDSDYIIYWLIFSIGFIWSIWSFISIIYQFFCMDMQRIVDKSEQRIEEIINKKMERNLYKLEEIIDKNEGKLEGIIEKKMVK